MPETESCRECIKAVSAQDKIQCGGCVCVCFFKSDVKIVSTHGYDFQLY